jgi:hypothetical protein
MTQLRRLDLHFKYRGHDLRSVFNFFASLFAFAAFAYCTYATPAELLWLTNWIWYLGVGLVMAVAYFAILFTLREAVEAEKDAKKWPVLVNFVLYILLFVSLTTGFALIRLRGAYILVTGTVRNSRTHRPLDNAFIEFRTHDGSYAEQASSDRRGHFAVYLERTASADIGEVRCSRDGYDDEKQTLLTGDHVRPNYALELSEQRQ